MAARGANERLDRLEDGAIHRTLAINSLTDFNNLVVKPLVEEVRELEEDGALVAEKLASFEGALRTIKTIGGILAFLISIALTIILAGR